MIKPLKHDEENEEDCVWLKAFYSDFRRRLVNLLGYEFRTFASSKFTFLYFYCCRGNFDVPKLLSYFTYITYQLQNSRNPKLI